MEKCPHCGGEPTVDKALRDGYRGMEDDPDAWAFFVICKSCAGQGGWVKNESGAIRMWNMRMTDADNPKDKEEIELLKDEIEKLRHKLLGY
jgi:Lar family restriction alleviation protein